MKKMLIASTLTTMLILTGCGEPSLDIPNSTVSANEGATAKVKGTTDDSATVYFTDDNSKKNNVSVQNGSFEAFINPLTTDQKLIFTAKENGKESNYDVTVKKSKPLGDYDDIAMEYNSYIGQLNNDLIPESYVEVDTNVFHANNIKLSANMDGKNLMSLIITDSNPQNSDSTFSADLVAFIMTLGGESEKIRLAYEKTLNGKNTSATSNGVTYKFGKVSNSLVYVEIFKK